MKKSIPSIPLFPQYESYTFRCTVCNKIKSESERYNPNWSVQRFILCQSCAAIGKHCSRCEKFKLFSAFPKATNSVNRGGVAAYCLPCKGERQRAEYKIKGKSETQKRSERARYLRKTFNIGIEEYEALYEQQHGLCACCGQSETAIRKTGFTPILAVDHNHETGAVRSLLCMGCNVAFGHLRESPERIEALLNYAKKWNT